MKIFFSLSVFCMTASVMSLPAFADGPAMPNSARICSTCHSFGAGEAPKTGPNLYGVFGRTAGTSEGFTYSTAMQNSGIVWSDETLSAYLENPRAYIPGNQMSYAGMRNPRQRAEVLEYLHAATEPAE
ncbi:cytochrome c family protein [Ponticaulis sp.]|uniref:c-type cytochrome n=1 Tax=Ponticaulis sp. TaxID=2020902 RepID=UPI000B6E1BE4|nr:cytochrome c family protein [Ponticaulis sp.]MAI90328.1 cytochrome c family protein [Ponticaulis sp.]OUX99966.1 MAG: hypothetical protein CBB65_07800 [Hyphomonadaceae bacterium TMED5]|tara:strand:+ start:303348 stop:303731 length:384 start_codon:yes stop_codon:yes gene_type:complete